MGLFFIRADANTTIATGHIMRCLSIADRIKANGGECIFITGDHFPDYLIESRGFEHICLVSAFDNMEGELPDLYRCIDKYNPSGILIDSYYVTSKYLRSLRDKVKIAYIDDVYAFDYPVDILINYSVYGKKVPYLFAEGCIPLLGTQYAPLRWQFANVKAKPFYEREKRILITAGGVDSEGMIKAVLFSLLNDERFFDYTFEIMVGKTYHDRNVIECKNSRVNVYQNVSDVVSLMKTVQYAVSAGGSTLYELCACKTPTVTFSVADNQFGNVKEFELQGIFPYAGDSRNGIQKCVNNVKNKLALLMADDRKVVIDKMSECVDGKGADRIAKVLLGAMLKD